MALTKCRACSNGNSGTPADFCLPLPTQIDHCSNAKASTSAENWTFVSTKHIQERGNGAVTLPPAPLSPFFNGNSTGLLMQVPEGPGSPGNSGVFSTNPGRLGVGPGFPPILNSEIRILK